MQCYFCQRNIKDIDFKEIQLLRNFVSGLGKIRHRRKSGLCSKHQRQVAKAIKRAKHLGLLSYTTK